jgi:hypothetical protein
MSRAIGEPAVTVSVVSHAQNALVNRLLEDIERVCAGNPCVVVTENIADREPIRTSLRAERIVNSRVKGFGANHNAAFARCRTPYFCVVNPDIRLPSDPLPGLLAALQEPAAGVAGPLVRTSAGATEDSARRDPTPGSLLRKAFAGRQLDYACAERAQEVDWVAGMFMLFRSESFAAVRGFDEGYFLYYEDADICRRLRQAGRRVLYDCRAQVVHDAQRASRRSASHLRWHLASMLRYFTAR